MTVGRKVVVGFLANLLNVPIATLGIYLLAQNAPPQSLGMFAFGLAAYQIIGFFADFGFQSAFVRTKAAEPGNANLFATYKTLRIRLLLSSITLAAMLTLAWHAMFGFTDATTLPVMFVALSAISFDLGNRQNQALLLAHQQTANLQLGGNVEVLTRTFALGAFAIFAKNWDPNTWALAIGGSYLAGYVASYVWLKVQAKRFVETTGKFDRAEASKMWALALPLALAGFLVTLNVSVDRVMVGYFWDATQVGEYFLAQRISFMIQIIPTLLAGILLPAIAGQLGKNDVAGARATIALAGKRLALVIVPAAAYLFAFSEEAIHLSGDSYQGSVAILKVFSIIAITGGFVAMQAAILTASKHVKIAVRGSIFGALLNFTLNLFLIPTGILILPGLGLGALGSAVATAISQFIVVGYYWYQLRKIGGYQTVPLRIISLTALSAVAVILFQSEFVIRLFGNMDRIWEIGFASIVFVVGGIVALLAFRQVDADERKFILHSIHPMELLKYVRREVRGKE